MRNKLQDILGKQQSANPLSKECEAVTEIFV
ncbi:hypothetical protein NSE_0390 [Neorickettsia sennetsu str. Miyayama]|uniref:Uncharacterized protein n=1 Tax=Ehrlichia sennetsu (strain ATCC VR-367 / Miyayama) TaxID=222891 RepID=Q2GE17_EHRS3|nr:hypothetical protein NSE_0390 [Neorickettsia sennetsu str. Miyayama]